MNEATKQMHRRNGFDVRRISGGQRGSYGPTIYEYEIVVIGDDVSYEDVLDYAITKVRKQELSNGKPHDLLMHLIDFHLMMPAEDKKYYYKCGHDYTG